MHETGEGVTNPTAGAAPGVAVSRAERDVLAHLGGRIGQYELIRPIGRGGMGAVYLARDTRLGRLVAVKIVRDLEVLSAERFRVEARVTARCVHENIVVIHDIGEHAGHLYMALEYLSGVTLKQWMERRRTQAEVAPLPIDRAIEIITPVVRAMVCAHEHGIVHRDLKPSNIMLTDAGVIKVLDFGVAKLFESADPRAGGSQSLDEGASPDLTTAGLLVGSGFYMSPEQRGADEVDHRSDIWAVGVILFELVAGRHPLRGKVWTSLTEVGNLDAPMPRVADVRADVGKLGSIVDRCLIKRKADRIGSARELLAELEALAPAAQARRASPPLGDEESPYAGLAAFQEGDADRFFGRTRDVAYAAVLLREQPLLAVVGPSGAGKSSFVRAGVVPALKHSGDTWEALVLRPGRHPLAALAGLLLGDDTSSSSSTGEADRDALLARMRHEPGYLAARLRARARRKLCRTLVFVDQFEELYTLGADTDERRAFATCLEAIADDAASPLRVLVTIRSDFLDRVTETPQLMNALVGGILLLPPLAREGLRESLVHPLASVGYRFENDAMVDDMLDALEHTRGALPLLQFTAAKLWESRDRSRQLLSESSYRAIGGVAGTLASHADAVLASVSTRDQALARAIFERLVTPERTRAIASLAELRELTPDADQAERVLTRLVEARLLIIETDAERQGSSATIVHESLIERWPTLSQWLNEHQEDAAFLARLRSAAKEWRQSGKPSGLLWRDEAMLEARRWRRRSAVEVSAGEAQFLAAVFALAESAARRRRLFIVGLLVSLVAVAAAMSSLAWLETRASQRAQDETEHAHSAALREAREATRARDAARVAAARELDHDPTLALALLREVEEPTQQRSWATLAARVLRAPVAQTVLGGMQGTVWTAAWSPDGRRVVAVSNDEAWVWAADGTGAPVVLRGHTGPVWSASFSPDGKHVLTSSWDGTARVWNADGTGAPVVLRQDQRISWAEFSPDGSHVATASWDRAAWVWRSDGVGAPVVLRGHTDRVRRVSFSPDGKRVVTAAYDHTARVWNADGSGTPVVLAGHTAEVWTVAFSPDGKRIVTASKDSSARLWNADGTGTPVVLSGHTNGVAHAGFSHDGRHIVTTSWDGTARVWNGDGTGPPVVLAGHTDDVFMAVFSPDDKRLVTCSVDKTARVWNADGSGAPVVLSGFEGSVVWVAYSPDGERLLTASGDAAVRIWSAQQPNAPVVLAGPPDEEIRSASFSPDGTRVLTFTGPKGLTQIWNADGSGPPLVLDGHSDRVHHAEFSPDGRQVVTGSYDGTTRVWNVDGSGTSVLLRDPPAEWTYWASFSPDGKRVVTGHDDGKARLWNADGTGQPLRLPFRGAVLITRFSPDGKHLLLVSSDDNALQVWNADGSGAPVLLRGHTNNIHWATWSPDGIHLVTASGDNTARVWRADGVGEPVVLAHTHEVRRVDFSPDGRHVVTASDDGTARVWNADGTGTPVVLRGHDKAVLFASFSPDGTRVVTASEDVVRVWRADGEGVPIVLEGFTAMITEVAFSPDGSKLATSTKDGKTWIAPRVDRIPSVSGMQELLWQQTSYCMPVEQRRELVGETEEAARESYERCRRRVAAERTK